MHASAVCSGTTCDFVCDTGFSRAGAACLDLDECATNNGGCSANATCTNTPGARTCGCNPGFTGDGSSCTDLDECAVSNGGCDANATCTNVPGARTCACRPGYAGAGLTCSSLDWSQWPPPPDAPADATYVVMTDPTSANDTVLDTVTGLVWQRDIRSSSTWAGAATYCDGLVLAGQADWRLPRLIELASIVDYGHVSPAINPMVFPYLVGNQLTWSSSPAAWDPDLAWVVDFGLGTTSGELITATHRVRCVR